MIDSSRDLESSEKPRDRGAASPAPPPATIVGLGQPEAPVAAATEYAEDLASNPAIAKHTLVGFPGPPRDDEAKTPDSAEREAGPLEADSGSDASALIPVLSEPADDEVTVVGGYDDVTTVTPWDVRAAARIAGDVAAQAPAVADDEAWPEVPDPPLDTAPEAVPGPLVESPHVAARAAEADELPPTAREPVLPLSAIIAEAPPEFEGPAVPLFDAPTLQTPFLALAPSREAAVVLERAVSAEQAPGTELATVENEASEMAHAESASALPPDPPELLDPSDEPTTMLPDSIVKRSEVLQVLPPISSRLSKPPPSPPRRSERASRNETVPPPSSDRDLFVARDTELQLFAPPIEMFGPGPRVGSDSDRLPAFSQTVSPLQSDAPWYRPAERESTAPRRSRGGRMIWVGLVAAGLGAVGVFSGLFSPSTGRVLVTVSGPQDAPVTGAAVLVDGKHGCSPAPCRIALKEGAYVIGISAPAYRRAAEKAFSVTPGAEEAIHFTLLPNDTSGIDVRSPIAGLRVVVDGFDRGTTPTTVRGLSAGRHTIRLSGNANYLPLETELSLEADRIALFEPKLAQAPEVVAADALAPKSAVPASPAATPPASPPLNLTAAASPPFLAKLRTAAPVPAAKVDLDTPEPTPAVTLSKLTITSTPPSNVVVDGRPLGSTPRELQVSAGEHSIVFIHPTKGRKSVQVRAQGGKAAVASVKF